MKKPYQKLLIPLAMLVALTPAFAEGPTGDTMQPATYEFCREANMLPDFRHLDIDRDGLVNYREMRSADERNINLFAEIDRNHDDYISPRELDSYTKIGNCGEEQ